MGFCHCIICSPQQEREIKGVQEYKANYGTSCPPTHSTHPPPHTFYNTCICVRVYSDRVFFQKAKCPLRNSQTTAFCPLCYERRATIAGAVLFAVRRDYEACWDREALDPPRLSHSSLALLLAFYFSVALRPQRP